MVMVLSRGSPGTICQWWNTERQNAWPWVWVRKSVSKPKESMAGTKALMVYNGEPGTGGILGHVASSTRQHCVNRADTVGRGRHLDEEVGLHQPWRRHQKRRVRHSP